MNIAVSFSLRFARKQAKSVIREFSKRAVLYLQSNHIYILKRKSFATPTKMLFPSF